MRRFFVASLLLFCGCSEDATTSPGFLPIPPPAAPTGPELSPRDTQLVGSWELAFSEVSAEAGSGGTLPDGPRPTIGNRARLDIRGTPDARITAILTPRWGRRVVFSMVTADYDRLIIEEHDSGRIPKFSQGAETNGWEKLTFPRGPDGALVGSFKATGFIEITNDASRHSFSIEGNGWVKPDTLAPELRLAPPPIGNGGKYLPWDRLVVDLAEPTPMEAVASALKTELPNYSFSATDSSGPPKAETTSFTGIAQTFTQATRKITLEPKAKDPSGNVVAPLATELVLHDLGEPQLRHDFDTAASGALWSATRITDTRCEKGGCILFPAEVQTACTANGVAGFLSTRGDTITRVKARVRALASDAPDALGAPNAPYILPPVFFRIGTPSHYQGLTAYEISGVKLLRTGTEDLPWESAWTTIEIDINGPLLTDKIGFHVLRPVCEYPSIPKVKDVKVAILIDDVWAE